MRRDGDALARASSSAQSWTLWRDVDDRQRRLFVAEHSRGGETDAVLLGDAGDQRDLVRPACRVVPMSLLPSSAIRSELRPSHPLPEHRSTNGHHRPTLPSRAVTPPGCWNDRLRAPTTSLRRRELLVTSCPSLHGGRGGRAPCRATTRPSERATWLRVCDVAELFGVSRNTVRRWTDDGRIAVHRSPGGHRRYRRDAKSSPRSTPSGKPAALERTGRRSGALRRASSTTCCRSSTPATSSPNCWATSPADVPRRLAERLCAADRRARSARSPRSTDGRCASRASVDSGGACRRPRRLPAARRGPRQRLAALAGAEAPPSCSAGATTPGSPTTPARILDERGCDALVLAPMVVDGRFAGTVELCADDPDSGRARSRRRGGVRRAGDPLPRTSRRRSSACSAATRAARRLARDGVVCLRHPRRRAAPAPGRRSTSRRRSRPTSATSTACRTTTLHLRRQRRPGRGVPRVRRRRPCASPTTRSPRPSLDTGEPFLVNDADDPRMSDLRAQRRSSTTVSASCTACRCYAAGRPGGVHRRLRRRDPRLRRSTARSSRASARWSPAGSRARRCSATSSGKASCSPRCRVGHAAPRERPRRHASRCDSVGRRLMDFLDVDTVEVYRINDGRIHYLAGASKTPDDVTWSTWSDDLSNYPLTEAALAKRDVLVIPNLDDPRLTELRTRALSPLGLQSEICVPLIVEDRAHRLPRHLRHQAARLRRVRRLSAQRRPGRGARPRELGAARRGRTPQRGAARAGADRRAALPGARPRRAAAARRAAPDGLDRRHELRHLPRRRRRVRAARVGRSPKASTTSETGRRMQDRRTTPRPSRRSSSERTVHRHQPRRSPADTDTRSRSTSSYGLQSCLSLPLALGRRADRPDRHR